MGQSRNEDALENILGAQNELLPPMSRNEKILHAILGEDIPLDEPQSRIEELLMQIYEQGGGGGGDVYLEQFASSAEYRSGTMSDTDYNNLNNSDFIIAIGTSTYGTPMQVKAGYYGITSSATQTASFRTPFNASSQATGQIVTFSVKKASPHNFSSPQAWKDGTSLGNPKIQLLYYKIKFKGETQ